MVEHIYEPNVSYLQGKTVHHKLQHVDPVVVMEVPKGILDRYTNVTLCLNLMYINGFGFLSTIS